MRLSEYLASRNSHHILKTSTTAMKVRNSWARFSVQSSQSVVFHPRSLFLVRHCGCHCCDRISWAGSRSRPASHCQVDHPRRPCFCMSFLILWNSIAPSDDLKFNRPPAHPARSASAMEFRDSSVDSDTPLEAPSIAKWAMSTSATPAEIPAATERGTPAKSATSSSVRESNCEVPE